MKTYLECQFVPFLVAKFVSGNIVNFSKREEENDQNVYANQHPISSLVEWLVVSSVDIRCSDATALHHHWSIVSIWLAENLGLRTVVKGG